MKTAGVQTELSIEYLDSRRFAYGAQMEPLAQAMAVKYANYQPDVVVTSDNAALDFALQHRARLFPQAPIVFTGYNDFRPEALKGQRNITGINEATAIEDTVTLALRVHPNTGTLAFVTSTGEASSKRIGEIAEHTLFPKLRERFDVVVMKDASVQEIGQRLQQLPANSLLFLSGQARDTGNGRALTPAENGSRISAVSPFPVYTFWDFHLNRGVVGGHIITGEQQGRAAAQLLMQVLAGTAADSIPVVMTTPTTDIFDYAVMQRFGIQPSNLPPGAQIINRPTSLWSVYRWQIVGVLALLLAEALLIALLLRIARGRRLALQALSQERALLEQRVAQRTAELQSANKQLAVLSTQDGLTGLANRRRLDEVLEAELLRLRRTGAPLSLILLDIDHFKNYNDAYGHVAGDEVLRQIGAVLAGQVQRSPDLAARYGGEEFCLVLPETDSAGAARLAERIRLAIEALAIAHAHSPTAAHVSASLGVLTAQNVTALSAQNIVEQADRLLYSAKLQGRNRVASGMAAPPAWQAAAAP